MSTSLNSVLISLKPDYARAIASGRKTIELRRRFPKSAPGGWLVQYVTLPVGAIVGLSKILEVKTGSIDSLWRRYRKDSAISRKAFVEYFADCQTGYAIRLGAYRSVPAMSARQMQALVPGFRPPQSYLYLQDAVVKALLRAARGKTSPHWIPQP